MTRMLQQARGRTQKPSFDAFSADAVKALYSLNRGLAMKKLKAERPERFSLLMDKRNGSSNALFFGLAQGVQRLAQSEGGGPGSSEASLLYELSVNEFAQSVTSLLRDPNDQLDYNGAFAGYIDDLRWAAAFDKTVEATKLALERGPAYGYKLSVRKSVYLTAPTATKSSAHETKRKTQTLNELGAPTQNAKARPDCRLDASIALADERRAECFFFCHLHGEVKG